MTFNDEPIDEDRHKKILELFDRYGLLLKQRVDILDLYRELKGNKERIYALQIELTGKELKEPHKIKIQL